MLQLTLTPGEYFTVDGKIISQLHRVEGERAHVAIEAPREVPVVRGAVLERQGGQRPACLLKVPARSRKHRWLLWDQAKEDSSRRARKLLRQIETPENRAEIAELQTLLDRLAQGEGLSGEDAAG